jgi:DNA (cytosine-5)-methyltransferase 1
MSSRPTFVDLFAGAGGLSLGLQRAGWDCLLALDNWPDASATYRRNMSGHPSMTVDVRDIDHAWLRRHLDQRPDWVVGGPPCQGWSTVGKRRWDDERNDLFTQFMRVVRDLEPNGFLIENVVGLRDMGADTDVRDLFANCGYTISFHVIRAADFGVPQLRHRVIFVGRRDGLALKPLKPTRLEHEHETVWSAIGDLPPVSPGETVERYSQKPMTPFQRKMRKGSSRLQGHTASAHPPRLVKAISFIPDGGNRTAIPPRYQPKSGFHNSYSRLNSKEPAVAVTSNLGKPSGTRCIHPFQNRGLTAREGARLQSFPDSFHFAGGIVSQRLQIANAVPPLLAERLGTELKADSAWTDLIERDAVLAA